MSGTLHHLASWAWQTSLYASVLVALVLAVQFFGDRLLSPRWRYALSLLVLARLLLPTVPESSLSVFNLAPGDRGGSAGSAAVELAVEEGSAGLALSAPAHPETFSDFGSPGSVWVAADVRGSGAPVIAAAPAASPPDRQWSILPWCWLLGVSIVLAAALRQQWALARWLRRSANPASQELQALLDACRAELGVRRRVRLLEIPGLGTAALCGIWRPKVLVPAGIADQLDREDLRLIFLHELAHLTKGDLVMNWLIVVARALHWFNPLAWLATRRLLSDREMARDEFVVKRTTAANRYGQTLVKLLEHFRHRRLAPGVAHDYNQQT